jgi:hypothetical protein
MKQLKNERQATSKTFKQFKNGEVSGGCSSGDFFYCTLENINKQCLKVIIVVAVTTRNL